MANEQKIKMTEDLSYEDITKIILNGEGETVEFKETYNVHFAKYCNTVAAFANTKGGFLIFGVRDDGQITGVSNNEKQRKNIINFILGNVKPDVSFDSYVLPTTTGEHLFILQVHPDPLNLHTSNNVPYKRIDSQNKPMEPSEIERYITNATKVRTEGVHQVKPVVKTKVVAGASKRGSLNEISTILFKVKPYLARLGYDSDSDLDFGEPAVVNGALVGFTDIRVLHKKKPAFVIEVKRDNARLTQTHINQGLRYAQALKLPFFALTNGLEFQLYNTSTGSRLSINGHAYNVVPFKKDLPSILDYLKRNPTADNIRIDDRPQVYKKGVNKDELIRIFRKCHNAIRDIEKDDEHAFADFSKILFLKLLEEKSEIEATQPDGFQLPRGWYFFDELKNNDRADQVMQAIRQMFASIKVDPKYGDIFTGDDFHADNEETYKYIVDILADISFQDSEVDAKGSAFEYFVKFNLRGSKLGQYFTPREVVNMMVDMVDLKRLVFSLPDPNTDIKVIDPSCGTGGFLIQGMQRLLDEVKKQKLPKDQEAKLIERVKRDVFWGSDANPTVARAAKMNMVVFGDGSSNIQKGNSLTEEVDFLRLADNEPKADYILANPPFGMSENRLPQDVMRLYDVKTTKGQSLFIQKMIKLTKPNGKICTVVDEGILNNPAMEDLRKYIINTCNIDAVVSLPKVTFSPSYTNVKTSFLLLTKKETEITRQTTPIFYCELKKIGYDSSYAALKPSSSEISEELIETYKEFQEDKSELRKNYSDPIQKPYVDNEVKRCYPVKVEEIENNYKFRMDTRFNDPETVKFVDDLKNKGSVKLEEYLVSDIIRGVSPDNKEDGKSVLKVRNITKTGEVNWDTDYVSEDVYERAEANNKSIKKDDVLLASTGVGSLGKAAHVDRDVEGVVDAHIAFIRVDTTKLNPGYLTKYLASKYGQVQIDRLYSGSTGQIEIYPEDISQIEIIAYDMDTQLQMLDAAKKNREQINKKIQKLQDELETLANQNTQLFEEKLK